MADPRRFTTWAMLLLGLSSATPAHERIRVTEVTDGCFSSWRRVRDWRHTRHGWRHGTTLLADRDVQALRANLLGPPKSREDLARALGLDAVSIEAHRGEIDSALHASPIAGFLARDSPEAALTPDEATEAVLLAATQEARLPDGTRITTTSTSTTFIEVAIPGDPPLVVSSGCAFGARASCKGMLPWTVRSGGREWQTFSLEASERLRLLLRPGTPHLALLDVADYWGGAFWHDSALWQSSVPPILGARARRHEP